MGDERARLTIGHDYCRGCDGPSTQRFAGWATEDAHENSCRPRAFYRVCDRCSTMRLVLGGPEKPHVNDAEGLCRVVLKNWLNRSGSGAAVGATNRPFGDGALDADDGLAFLQAEVWRLYTAWEPALSEGSFLAYASGLLPKRLATWSYNASGEANERTKVDHQRGGKVRSGGRKFPKAHAASVSVSLDGLTSGGDDGDGAELVGVHAGTGAFTPDHAEARTLDLLRALTAGGGGTPRAQQGAGDAAAERAQAAD